MEKNYSERVMEIKNEILDEIRKVLGHDKRHAFKNKFYIHYADGEVATTDVCHAVEVWFEGDVVFCVSKDENTPRDQEELIENETVFGYTADSFIDILNRLKKEIRKEKLSYLRDIVEKNGGEISFTGDFSFDGFLGGEYIENCYLASLRISDGEVIVRNIFEGSDYENDEEFFPDDELDKILEYVEEKTKESFALTDEQNSAIDELANVVRKIKSLNVKILWDFHNNELGFVNSRGKDVEVDMHDKVPNGYADATDFVVKLDVADRLFDPEFDTVCVEL